MPSPFAARALTHLIERVEHQHPAKLYAVLDGARDERIHQELISSGTKATCLFSGDMPPDLQAAAPWLVDLGQGDSAFGEWLVTEGWGQSWGIYFTTEAGWKDLLKHMRRYLMVKRGSEDMFFRYYDPRVLRVYLPTCNVEELEFVYGPVEEFLVEGKDPRALLHLGFVDDALLEETVALDEVSAA